MIASIKNIFLVSIFFAFFPLIASAAEVRLETNKVKVKTGEQLTAKIVVHAAEAINAVEGQLIFLSEMLKVKEVRDGNSVVNFWITKPRLEAPGVFFFSGITPGGFSGTNNLIFSVVFEAWQTGLASVKLQAIRLLLNDGTGAETSATLNNLAIVVEPGDSKLREETATTDKEAPEVFSPVLARDSALFAGKFFIAFATQDKNSGLSHYRIKEYRFKMFSFLTGWKTVQSPYMLQDQALKSYIVVQAVDNATNPRTVVLAPAYPLLWYESVFYRVIITIILFGFLAVVSKIWIKKSI